MSEIPPTSNYTRGVSPGGAFGLIKSATPPFPLLDDLGFFSLSIPLRCTGGGGRQMFFSCFQLGPYFYACFPPSRCAIKDTHDAVCICRPPTMLNNKNKQVLPQDLGLM